MLVPIPRNIPGAPPYTVEVSSKPGLAPELVLRLAVEYHARQRIPLRHVTLDGVNLIGANLDGLHLIDSNANGVDFSGASMNGTHLERVQAFLATLDYAEIKNSHFEVVNLGQASCEGMTVAATTMTGCNLREAKLTGSTFTDSRFPSCRTAGSAWLGASFKHCDTSTLEGADGILASTGMPEIDVEAQKFFASRLALTNHDEARRDAEAFRSRLLDAQAAA